MRLKFGHICRYAEASAAGLTLIGIFDFVTGQQLPEQERIQVPLFYLAALVGATSFEAGKHTVMIRLVDADGIEGGRMECHDAVFQGQEPGRELGTYVVAPIFGLTVPHFGDYVFEIWGGDNRLGSIDFTVREPSTVVPA